MLSLEDGKIFITKGDTGAIDVTLLMYSKQKYILQDGDTVTLSVRALPSSDSPLLIQIVSETYRILFQPVDTQNLDVGRYSCDIQVKTKEGNVYTVYPELEDAKRYKVRNFKNFIIMPEVTI